MLLISIEIAAGLSLPRRAVSALRSQRQKQAGFSHLPLLNRIEDWRYLNLSKLQIRNKILSPTPRYDKCQWSCSFLALNSPQRRAAAVLQSILPDMLPINPFKEWVTLYFLHTRCTNSVLPFTAKSEMEGRMKMKEKWKWKHSIQKWNGFLNWYYYGFLTYKWRRARTPTTKPTHRIMLRNVMSNATNKMWYSFVTA